MISIIYDEYIHHLVLINDYIHQTVQKLLIKFVYKIFTKW